MIDESNYWGWGYMDIDITAITTTLLEQTPFVGILGLMWIYIHKTFNKFQDSLTRQNETLKEQNETHSKNIKEVYDNVNKDIFKAYNELIQQQKEELQDLRNINNQYIKSMQKLSRNKK